MSHDASLTNIHPGEVIREDFLIPMGISGYRLAKAIGLSQTHINDLLNGQRNITANVALRLSAFFGTSPELWLNLQNRFDLQEADEKYCEDLKMIVAYRHPGTDVSLEVLAEIRNDRYQGHSLRRESPHALIAA